MFLPYDCSIVKDGNVIEKMTELNADKSISPVIMGTKSLLAHHVENVGRLVEEDLRVFLMDNLGSVEIAAMELAESAGEIDAAEWFNSRVSVESYGSSVDESGAQKAEANYYRDHPGSSDELWIVETPTELNWRIPAYMNFGGWSSCPNAKVHVAIHKRWSELYGSEIVTLTNDTMEVLVTSPPRTIESALELAREQYVYAPTVVEKNAIDELAVALKDNSIWTFTWE